MTPTPGASRVRRIGRAAMRGGAAVGSCYVLFRLLEPMVVYNHGWRPMPDPRDAPAVTHLHDPTVADRATRAEAILRRAHAGGDYPALSVAVAANGQLAWRGAIGFADLVTRTPVTLDHSFRLGSTSKAVTAVAIGTLLARDELDLDTRMSTWSPTLGRPLRDVTLGQAMSHRAGVRNYGVCACFPLWEHLNRRHFASVREAVGVVEGDPLLFEPGTGFAYTSLGYNLAALAVEAASAQPFHAYVQHAVAEPLALQTLRVDVPGDAEGVGFYDVEPRGYKAAFEVDNSIRVPSGGFRASPGDMAKLGLAMTDARLLPGHVQAALLTVPPGGTSEDAVIYANAGGWAAGTSTAPDPSSTTTARPSAAARSSWWRARRGWCSRS